MKFTTNAALERLMNDVKYVDKSKAWIGTDLDGTLAKYDGWKGWQHIGDPIPKMVERVKSYIRRGITVKVWTARASKVSLARSGASFEEMSKVIQDWTEKHIGVRLEVVTEKDCDMLFTFDDSVIQVEPNTGNIIGSEIFAEVGDDTDYDHPIKDYLQSDISGLFQWNEVDLDNVFYGDFTSGLLKGGFHSAENLDVPGSQFTILAKTDTTQVKICLNTCCGHLNKEDDTVWCVVDTYVANGDERMLFKLDNLSFRSLGKWYAERILKH